MAKLKSDITESNVSQTQQEPITADLQNPAIETPETATKSAVDDGKKEEKVDTKTTPKGEATNSIEPHIDSVLKAYSTYKTLYVDAQGGAFPDGTPLSIRGKAKLYTNPHFKS